MYSVRAFRKKIFFILHLVEKRHICTCNPPVSMQYVLYISIVWCSGVWSSTQPNIGVFGSLAVRIKRRYNTKNYHLVQHQKKAAFRGSSVRPPPYLCTCFIRTLIDPMRNQLLGPHTDRKRKKKKIISFCNCPPILHYTAHRKKGVAQNPENYEEMPRIEYFKLGK